MKNISRAVGAPISRRRCLAGLAVSTTYLNVTAGQEPGAAQAETIFDGNSLDGWHTNRDKIGHGTGGQWRVENGVLIGEQDPPGSGNGGLLLTDRKYDDFELTLDMHPDWGPCSGVFFRCTEEGAGFQMYVDYHDNGNVGHLRGEMPGSFAMMPFKITGQLNASRNLTGFTTNADPRTTDWPAGVYEHTCTADDWLDAWRVNEWNSARIRCVGKYPQITTWINGTKICHFDGDKSTLPAYDKDRVFGILGRSGSIGLQVHGGKGWPKGAKCRWRNISVRELG